MADLAGVHPALAARAQYLLEVFQAHGWPLVLTSGLRSPERQLQLIKAGITQTTNSKHTEGRAFDVSFSGFTREQALALPAWIWQAVGEAGERLGLRWGGRFRDFDPFHFDA